MSYINRNLQIFIEHPIRVVPVRSEARLKSYFSSTDLRAWSYIVEQRRNHILDYVAKNKEGVCFDKDFPLEALLDAMMACKNCRIKSLQKHIKLSEKLLSIYSQIDLTVEQQRKLKELLAAVEKAYKDLEPLECYPEDEFGSSGKRKRKGRGGRGYSRSGSKRRDSKGRRYDGKQKRLGLKDGDVLSGSIDGSVDSQGRVRRGKGGGSIGDSVDSQGRVRKGKGGGKFQSERGQARMGIGGQIEGQAGKIACKCYEKKETKIGEAPSKVPVISKVAKQRCASLIRQAQERSAIQAVTSGGVVIIPQNKKQDIIPPGYLPGETLPNVLKIKECDQRLHGQYIHHIPLKASEGKEIVKVFGGDGTKEMIVPSRDPVDVPAILPKTEYQRLKQQAHVLTLKDRMAILEEAEKKKNQLAMESMQRKQLLTKAQQEQRAVPGSKLDSVESEAAEKNLYLLKRSHELILEQDDRVKRANGVILATKCRAIRNAQIAEKKLIEKQLNEENKRLDMMMEQQRQKVIEIEEKKREDNKRKIHGYVTEVKQQIKENELERLLEAERVEEESRMLNKALIALQKEEEEKQRQKAELQLKMREEFKKSNAEAEHYRNIKLEEQRISDLRIQQFMKEKAEREEAREKELALAAAAKEQEIARLRAAQEKSADHQAAMDEMNALRTQEEKEKEWREKEKAAAKKKKELLEDLRNARAKQIDDIRKAQAQSLAREEEGFMKVARVQRELFEKDMEERKRKKELTSQHQRELLKQINEKERQRINERREKFEDGKAQRLEVEINDRNIEGYLKEKVGSLSGTNLPSSYIRDIERQLKLNM